MSLAKSLRTFLINIEGHSIAQVAQEKIPANCDLDLGVIWFARRSTTPLRTLEQAAGANEQQYFDIEIYHPDIDTTELFADLLQAYDGYRGEFGTGRIQAMFVDGQTDDYVQRAELTDTENLSASFLSLEIRSYRE